jgi:hypothetical protein
MTERCFDMGGPQVLAGFLILMAVLALPVWIRGRRR